MAGPTSTRRTRNTKIRTISSMKSFVKALHGCFLALLHTKKANYTYTPPICRTIYRQDNAHRDICANSSRQPPITQVILSCVSAGNIATEMWQGQTNWRHGRKGIPQFGITECSLQYKCRVNTSPSHAIRSELQLKNRRDRVALRTVPAV